ncbi:MAG: ATP-binding cassette domain-containing protein [Candidatus Solibacter usitatus]|nr:ATP-binding cassette domain-containing protein [Candidatus Solibacter usitatus]
MIDARIRKGYAGGRDSAAFALDIRIRTTAGVTVLFGPSGAGKSLTLDALAGFVRPDDGRILLDDVLLFDAASGVNVSPQKRRCGYVFQSSALFPHMDLRGNLAFAAERMPRLERRRTVSEMIEQFHLAEVAGRKPGELSGGQRQRGSIARALLSKPRLLLLDEPSSGLDNTLREELYRLLAEVRVRYRTPILLVTHDLDEALELGEEMIVMQAGRVAQSGAPVEILQEPASEEIAALLGRFNIFDAEITAMDPAAHRSRLRCTLAGGRVFETDGPYFPGHLLGARLRLGIRADALRVSPFASAGVPLRAVRVSRRSQTYRLEFEGGVVAEVAERGFEPQSHNGEWVVEFPPGALRILK